MELRHCIKGKTMNGKKSASVLKKKTVNFNNVAMYFSEEEWMFLEKWQKDLYWDVMKEIHKALLSLGHFIVHPDVLVRIKDELPCVGDNNDTERKQTLKAPRSGTDVKPDILLRIKQDEQSFGKDYTCEEKIYTDTNTAVCTDFNPELPLLVKSVVEPDSETLYYSNGNECVGETETKSDVLQVKQNETHFREPCMSAEKGAVDRTSADSTNFNPEFSLWIKQVEEPGVNTTSDSDKEGASDPTTDCPDDLAHLPCNIKQEMEMFPITQSEIREICESSSRGSIWDTFLAHLNQNSTEIDQQVCSLQRTRTMADGNGAADWMAYFEEPKLEQGTFKKSTGNCPRVSDKSKLCEKKHAQSSLQEQATEGIQQIPLAGYFPYKCGVCEKVFRFKSCFLRHKRIHTGEKPFKCNQCEKSFNQKENLTKHVMTHSDDKSYKCPECEKGFSSRAYLRIHKRIHTGEKPYSCSECGKCFSHNSYLIHHRRTHIEDKPFKCADCMKSFVQNFDLVRHRRTHTGEKPFQCTDCKKAYSNKWGLMRHQKTHSRIPG